MPTDLFPYDPTTLRERCAELDDWRARLDSFGTLSRRSSPCSAAGWRTQAATDGSAGSTNRSSES